MNRDPQVKILVCCHKPGIWLDNDVYMPIQCGKAVSNIDLGIQGDDTRDNISAKNSNYCELTAMYWAWKNLKDVDYVGLCHYRRFFNLQTHGWGRKCTHIVNSWDKAAVSPSLIKTMLLQKDIILAKPAVYSCSVKKQYCIQHVKEDLDMLRAVLIEKCPDFVSAYDFVMEKTNCISPYNMFMTNRELFQSYCEWLFDILFAVEKRIPLSGYPYQARVFGFMAERLLNVYCRQYKLNVDYRQVCIWDDNRQDKSWLSYQAKRSYLNLLFYLGMKK